MAVIDSHMNAETGMESLIDGSRSLVFEVGQR